MARHVVEIPRWHPPLKNQWEGCHWGKKARIKKAAREVVSGFCRPAGACKATVKRRVTLIIQLGYRQRGGDPDAYWKALLDGLVSCGALVNDSKEWVELAPVKYERGGMGTVIILEDIGDGTAE